MGELIHRRRLAGPECAETARREVTAVVRAAGLEPVVRATLVAVASEAARAACEAVGELVLEERDGALVVAVEGPASALAAPAAWWRERVDGVRLDTAEDTGRATLAVARELPAGTDAEALRGALDAEAEALPADGRDELCGDRELRELVARLLERERELERLDGELVATNQGVVALYAALDERDQRKNEFLATLAHELRNPLGVVRTAVHALGDANGDGGEGERPLRVAERQLRHLARLVDDLLDVSRIDQGKITLRREELDLRRVVERVVEDRRGELEARRLRIVVDPASRPLPLSADPTRLEQVVDNLLSNAVKYTPEGGEIALRSERDGGEAVLTVSDTGIGIEPDMLERIFDLFAQAEQSLDRSGGGLGLGLTLVQRLVDLHGGTVRAQSEGSGRGSRFTVRLPLAEAEREDDPAQEEGPEERPSERPTSVLVVEDNDDAREMLALLLRGRGFRVETAGDGPSGVERAARGTFDAAVVDIGLPELDGYEVARRLRAEGSPDLLLVALSGYGRAEDRERSGEAGFDHHLVKPVEPDRLCELLRRVQGRDGGGTGDREED